VPITRVLSLRRDAARIIGERDALIANIARSAGRISEIELQLLQIDEKVRAEAQREIRDIEARVAELNEQKVAAEDLLRRVELRAPQSGIVHDLAVHTIGGVIGAGETIMSIVPVEDALTVEVRLVPTDIDQVTVGQKTLLRFPAFNQRTTPELFGSVSRVAADLSTDPKTGTSFYIARVRIDPAELHKLNHVKLMPGMPVESFIQTSERTALSYLTKPIADQMARAFKEE
jgi:HlyD family secretion protein